MMRNYCTCEVDSPIMQDTCRRDLQQNEPLGNRMSELPSMGWQSSRPWPRQNEKSGRIRQIGFNCRLARCIGRMNNSASADAGGCSGTIVPKVVSRPAP